MGRHHEPATKAEIAEATVIEDELRRAAARLFEGALPDHSADAEVLDVALGEWLDYMADRVKGNPKLQGQATQHARKVAAIINADRIGVVSEADIAGKRIDREPLPQNFGDPEGPDFVTDAPDVHFLGMLPVDVTIGRDGFNSCFLGGFGHR